MMEKSEKLTLAKIAHDFNQQGYNFNAVRKNVLIYNYDRWNWYAGSFMGWRGLNMPFADQVQRVRKYLEADKRCKNYEMAGLVMAGVDDDRVRDGWQVVGPKLETRGLYHVYNVIMRDVRTGQLMPMAKNWVASGVFDTRKNLEYEIVSAVVSDVLVKNGAARKIIFDGLQRQK